MPTGQRPNPPAHVAHFAVRGTVLGGSTWANTFWLRNGNAQTPTQSDFQSVVVDAAAQWNNNFKGLLSNQLTINDVTGLYYGPTGGELFGETVLNQQGGDTEPSTPANVAACIGFTVQQHYRGGHPRMYLAGIGLSKLQDPSHFSTAFVTACVQAANAMNNGLNQTSHGNFSSSKMGIVSFVLRKEWRNPPVFRDFITNAAHMDARVDSMRRRLGRDIPP